MFWKMDENVLKKVSEYSYARIVDRTEHKSPMTDVLVFTRNLRSEFNTNPFQPFMDGGARNILSEEYSADKRYAKQLPYGYQIRGIMPRIR